MTENVFVITDKCSRSKEPIFWSTLTLDNPVLKILGPKEFDKSLRASASRFNRDRYCKIRISGTTGGWICTLGQEKKNSGYRQILKMEIGQILNLPWTWTGQGNPPEYRNIRRHYLNAIKQGMSLHWSMWNKADGVTITRKK